AFDLEAYAAGACSEDAERAFLVEALGERQRARARLLRDAAEKADQRVGRAHVGVSLPRPSEPSIVAVERFGAPGSSATTRAAPRVGPGGGWVRGLLMAFGALAAVVAAVGLRSHRGAEPAPAADVVVAKASPRADPPGVEAAPEGGGGSAARAASATVSPEP